MRLLDGFTSLLKRSSKRQYSGKELLNAVEHFNVLRLRYHHVQFICPPLQTTGEDFQARFAFNLVIGALNNLVDNALYWLQVRWPELPETDAAAERKLYITISREFEAGPAIVVADNGPGFQEHEPETLARPFFTRKPEGMGLGLYYAKLAMELNGGELVFPQAGEVEIPEEYDGAVVALVFKEMP